MATKDIANKEYGLRAVCSAPDMCRVGKDVIPFDSFRDLSHEKAYSPNVKARGVPVLTVNSVVAGTTGNAGQGITSQVSQGSGDVRITSGSGTVITNRLAQAYHLSDVQMNCRGAVCNTSGKLYTGTATPLKATSENKQPCNQPPKTDVERDELKARRAALQKTFGADSFDQSQRLQGWADGAQGYLDKTYANNQAIRDQWVASQSPGLARGAATAVAGIDGVVDQGATAVAGLAKDMGIGLGQLLNLGVTKAYENNAGAQMAQRAMQGLSMQDLDALILAKNIQLGNVCAGSVWQGVKDAGKAIVQPVVHEWEQGRPIGAVTRAAGEIAMTVGTMGAGAVVKGGATSGSALGRVGEAAAAAGRVERGAEVAQSARAAEAAAEVGPATGTAIAGGTAGKAGSDGVRVGGRPISLRERYLGRTPGKGSRTGREVQERMREEGKLRENGVTGATEFQASDGKWYDISKADMTHRSQDAVSWWNDTGRAYGARSTEVRTWMLDPDNYVLDHFSINRSAGATLGHTVGYLPPLN